VTPPSPANAEPAVAVLTEHIERAPRELIAYAQQHSLDAAPASATAKTLPPPPAPPAAPAQALQAGHEVCSGLGTRATVIHAGAAAAENDTARLGDSRACQVRKGSWSPTL